MPEVIVFPDATVLYCDYLRAELTARGYTGIHVGTRVPNPRPTRFIRVLRTGGSRRNLVVDDTMLTVEAWADAEEDAQDLAQLARALIAATRGTMLAGTAVYTVDDVTGPGALPSGPTFVPDPLSAQPRFSFSMVVAVRGAAVA